GVIVIENMSFTYDTRVSNIANTLACNGHRVWIICPRYPGDPLKRIERGITIWFFPLPQFSGGLLGQLLEYFYSFVVIASGTLVAFCTIRFDIIHICNPPDIF